MLCHQFFDLGRWWNDRRYRQIQSSWQFAAVAEADRSQVWCVQVFFFFCCTPTFNPGICSFGVRYNSVNDWVNMGDRLRHQLPERLAGRGQKTGTPLTAWLRKINQGFQRFSNKHCLNNDRTKPEISFDILWHHSPTFQRNWKAACELDNNFIWRFGAWGYLFSSQNCHESGVPSILGTIVIRCHETVLKQSWNSHETIICHMSYVICHMSYVIVYHNHNHHMFPLIYTYIHTYIIIYI
jgi:hypothetical protein